MPLFLKGCVFECYQKDVIFYDEKPYHFNDPKALGEVKKLFKNDYFLLK